MTKRGYIPSVVVPNEHAEVIAALIQLDTKTVKKISSAFGNLSSSLADDVISEDLSDLLPIDFPFEINIVENVLTSASNTASVSPSGRENVINDIKEKIEENRGEEIPEIEAENLYELFNEKGGLAKNSLAKSVYSSHDKVAIKFRILTDIRPIFVNNEADLEISDLVVYHNLQVSYLEDGVQKRTYYSLDSRDVRDLLGVVNRALRKESLISGEDSLPRQVRLVGGKQ